MTKLLHEQLQEWVNREPGDILTCLGYEFDCLGTGWTGILSSIAERIEREYMPRPRFEDGAPVQFGDDVRAESTTIKVNEIALSKDGTWHLRESDLRCLGGRGDTVVRPDPPILDADGVEIKVGDTVYSKHNGSPFTVEKVRTSDKYLCGKDSVCIGGGVFFPATDFTYEKPVFDTDGVRICKGDKVWHVNGSTPWNVVEINNGTVIIEDPLWSHDTEVFDAKNLTHQEPDSLERIKADREFTICEYNSKYPDAVPIGMDDHLLDRAIALIERGNNA